MKTKMFYWDKQYRPLENIDGEKVLEAVTDAVHQLTLRATAEGYDGIIWRTFELDVSANTYYSPDNTLTNRDRIVMMDEFFDVSSSALGYKKESDA